MLWETRRWSGSRPARKDSPIGLLSVTVCPVQDAVLVEVPGQFAEELVSAGFRKTRPVRDGGIEPVLTLVATGAGIGADMATILLAKDAVADFMARLRVWMTQHGKSQPGSEVVTDISGRSPDGDVRVHLKVSRTGPHPATDVDMQAAESLIGSVFTSSSRRHGRG
jgi:hypothetical protein